MASSVTAPVASPSPGRTPAEPRYSVDKKVRALYVSIITRFPRTIRQAEFHERMIRAPDSCRASDQAPVTKLGNPLLHNLPRPHKSDGINLTNHFDQHNRAFFLTRDRNCNICLKPTTSFWSNFRAFYVYYQARPAGKKTIFMPMCHVIPVCSQGDCLTKLKHISRDRFNEAFENLLCQYHRIDGTPNVSKAAIFEAAGTFKKALIYCGVCKTKWHSSQYRQAATFRSHLKGRCMASLLEPMSYNEGELESEGSEQADNEGSTPSHNEGRTHSEEVFHRRRISAWQKLRRGLDAGEDWSPAHSPAAPVATPGTNVLVRDENIYQDLSGPSGSGTTAVSSVSNSNRQPDYFPSPKTLAQAPRNPNTVPAAHGSLDVLENAHIESLDGISPGEAPGSNSQQAATVAGLSGDSGTLTDPDAANSSAPTPVPLEQVTSVITFPNVPDLPELPMEAPENALGHSRNPWGSKRPPRKTVKEPPIFHNPVYDLPAVKWHYPCAEPHCGTCVPCYGTIRSRGGWEPEAPAEASIDEGYPTAGMDTHRKSLKRFLTLFALSKT